jgi:hypothetical protein
MNSEVHRILRDQSGVITRRQALTAGLADHDIRRLLRWREWAPDCTQDGGDLTSIGDVRSPLSA